MVDKPADTRRFRAWQWRTLLVMMFCYLFYYLGRQNMGLAIPLLKEDLGYTSAQVGWFSTGLLIAYAIGQFINGNLGDRFGARLLVTMGGLLSMVLNWVTSMGTSFLSLLLPWTANGYVQSMGWAPGSRMISNWWPREERGRAFGLYMFAAGCSSILTAVVAGYVGHRFGWRGIFQLPVILLGVACVVFFVLARNKPEDVGFPPLEEETGRSTDGEPTDGDDPALARYGRALKNWRFMLACVVIGFQSFSRYGLLTWIPDYYKSNGFDIKQATFFYAFMTAGMAAGALSSGFVSDKVFGSNRCKTISIYLACAGVVAGLMMVMPFSGRFLAVVVLFLAGFFVYGAQSPLWAFSPDLLGRDTSGTGVGVMDCVAYIFAAASGALLGHLIDVTGSHDVVFGSISLVCLLGAAMILAVRR